MVKNKNTILTGRKQDVLYIAILLAITVGLGIYLIATTVLISKDSVFYIERAQKLSSKPIEVIQKHPPGYPFLIFTAHKFVTLFSDSSSVFTWIYPAQGLALLCRLLSVMLLYFIGKLLVGPRRSFWGLLILIILPFPAEFGSDVIREWPHLLFLSTGMVSLIYGARYGKWWMFAIAGLTAGFGHTIRSECAQIVIYGGLWLLLCLIIPRAKISRVKAACLILVLSVGFAIPTVPYVKLKGKVLPPKLKKLISYNTQYRPDEIRSSDSDDTRMVLTASSATDILKATGRLAGEISENMMYFFVLPLMAGLYCHFRKLRRVLLTERFFIFALIVLYLVMMILLHINYGHISRRHCMPIVVFTAFYIPVGLQIIAYWFSKKISKVSLTIRKDRRRWFFILITIGIVICIGKLVRITPLRWEKQGYLNAAKWLKENTDKKDIVAVTDKRITFYADRKGMIYNKKVPEQTKYIVKIVKAEDKEQKFDNSSRQVYSEWVNKREKKKRIVIYEVL